MSQQIPSSFCLFCYKDISSSVNIQDNFEEIKKFSKILSNRVFDKGAKNVLLMKADEVLCISKILKCCMQCKVIMDEFCEFYQKLESLQLKLNLNFEKLVGMIKLSDGISTRCINVDKTLKLKFQSDAKKIEESQKLIQTIRQSIINSDIHKSAKLNPQVFNKRFDKTGNVAISKPSIENTTVTKQAADHLPQITVNNMDIRNTGKESENVTENCGNIANITSGADHDTDVKIECPQNETSETVQNIFTEITKLAAHPRKNVKTACEICGQNFVAQWGKKHYTSHHDTSNITEENQIFRCKAEKCAAYFLSKTQLKSHFSKIHKQRRKTNTVPLAEYIDGIKYFRCETCKTLFDGLVVCKRHLLNSNCATESELNLINIECHECKEKFDTKNELWTHQHQIHSNEKKIICPKCGKVIACKGYFKMHMEYHKGPTEWKWKCNKCGKKSPTKAQLQRHIVVHMKDKQRKLKSLDAEHVTEKNSRKDCFTVKHACPQCDKVFEEAVHLKLHVRKAHKKFQCGNCGRRFLTGWNMKIHMTLHAEEPKSKDNDLVGKEITENQSGSRQEDDNIIASNNIAAKPDVLCQTKIPAETKTVSREQVQVKFLECTKRILGSQSHLRHKCKLCGKGFALMQYLKRHLKIHKDRQERKCNEIGGKCVTKKVVLEHRVKHTKNKTGGSNQHKEKSKFGRRRNLVKNGKERKMDKRKKITKNTAHKNDGKAYNLFNADLVDGQIQNHTGGPSENTTESKSRYKLRNTLGNIRGIYTC